MVHPASDKVLALSIVCHGAMEQGTPVKLSDNGDGRLRADKATATGDFAFGTFLAYWVSPDSADVDFVGAPGTTSFALNTDTGVGGGTHTIASGTEAIALGGSKIALIRMDKNSLYNTPASLASYVPGTTLKYHSSGRLCLDADDDVDIATAKVVQNDGASIVVLLA